VHTHGLDGGALRLDVTTVDVETPGTPATGGAGTEDTLVAVYLRDARTRLEREALAARLAQEQLRRRQALEINDNVVQGLVAAVYALEMGEAEASASLLDRTLRAARAMMDDLLEPIDERRIGPGDLVRSAATVIGDEPRPLAADGQGIG
jgi:hypothetical protein